MAVGPIPSSSILRHTQGWCPIEADMFRECIRAMDAAYLEREEKPQAEAPSAKDQFDAAFRGRKGRR